MTLKVLIADDHSLYRTGLALLLKDRLGVTEVIEVSDFDQALDRLAETPGIGLALFDLSMPGMGGPESLRVIKETYPDVRVAVVSGLEERDYVLKAISVGLNGYVPQEPVGRGYSGGAAAGRCRTHLHSEVHDVVAWCSARKS